MHTVWIRLCIDACFKQSHHKGRGDQCDSFHSHPVTVFVSKDTVSAMEEYVDSVHPQKDRSQKGRQTHKPDALRRV
jgi:hypothetical protein